MKVFWLILSTLFLLTTPAIAVEYQGRNLDDRKFAAKVYYQRTGGVYNVQVQFKRDRAILYFTDGGQVIIKLGGQQIIDPSNIVGFGRLGYVPLNNWFSIGLESSTPTNNVEFSMSRPSEDIWRIQLDPTVLQEIE